MRVYLVTSSGERRDIVDPYRVNQVVANGACPACGVEPFKVRWARQRYIVDTRAYEADGICARCEQPVGLLRAEPEQLFGARDGRARACG